MNENVTILPSELQYDEQTASAQWESFWSGNAHDFYGLIAIGALAVIIAVGVIAKWNWVLAVGILIITVAIFVDLWAHGWF